MKKHTNRVPCLLYPFWLIWRFIIGIIKLIFRIIGVFIGVILMIIGGVLTLTIIGAILGIPLIFLGFKLLLRSLS